MADARILTIDVGSSSVRASLYNGAGNYVSDTEAQVFYGFETTSDGVRLAPTSWWTWPPAPWMNTAGTANVYTPDDGVLFSYDAVLQGIGVQDT